MKKLLLIITIIATLTLTLVGCASTPVAGRAWADYEVLTYDVIENNAVIGSMTMTIEVLGGEQTLTIGGDTTTKYDLGSGSSGKRLTQTVTIDGKTVMNSQALVKDWTTVASYKLVDYATTSYTVNTTYSGKTVSYTKSIGGAEPINGTINVGNSGYIDNEFIYTYVRAYPQLDESMQKSITTIDYENMEKTSISISTTVENVEAITFEGEARACALMVMQHGGSPVGKSISARYFTREAYTKPSVTSSIYDSFRIPAEIIENNITYKLTNVEVK